MICSATAHAEPQDEKTCQGFSGGAGLRLERFDYLETRDNGQLLDRETGLLPGVLANAQLMCGAWQFALSATTQRAVLEYAGQTNTGRALETRTLEHVNDFAIQAGRNLSFLNLHSTLAYAGVGQRRWKRNIAGVGGVSGLNEIYRWRQIFVGANHGLLQIGDHRIAADLRWMRMYEGRLSVDFLGLFDQPADLALPVRNGWRVAIPWHYRLDATNTISAEPYAQGWRIPRGEAKPLARNGVVVGDFFEPASQTRLYGINATWSHLF